MKKNRIIIILCIVIMSLYLVSCERWERAYLQGQVIYIGEECYVETTGLYGETDKIINKIPEKGLKIYEIEGDTEHNYVEVSGYILHGLYVKENYKKDESKIEAVCFARDYKKFIYTEPAIELVKELLDYRNIIKYDEDELFRLMQQGKGVYLKYANDYVGECCGYIVYNGENYMFYNGKEKILSIINEEMKAKLAEYIEIVQ